MKKRQRAVRVIICICAAFGWWGMLYPELSMTPDTYVIIKEDGTVHRERDMIEWNFNSDIYRELLETDSSRICFKSKLLTQVEEWMEYLK